MRNAILIAAGIACFSAGAIAAPAALRLDQLAGRYTETFMNGLVDGSEYSASNEVEIRPIDATSATVALSLSFFNGHSCWIEGRARVEGRRLVLGEPEYENSEGKTCRLEIWKDRTRLRWSDGDNTCKDACGARGSFMEGSIPLRSKRRLPADPLSGD